MPSRPEFIRLANRIAGAYRPLSFEWNGQTAQFSFSNQRLAPNGGWKLNVVLAGHELAVELNRLPDLAWVSPTLVGIDLRGIPSELTCGLIEASFGEIFESLTKAGIDTHIVSAQQTSSESFPEESIEWCINRGGDVGWMRGRIAGSDAALDYLANLIQRAPVVPGNDDTKVPMTVSLVAGAMSLTLAEMQHVELHDVLLVDLNAFAKGRQCQLRAGKTSFGSGHLENNTFTLKQLISQDTPMATNAPLNDLEVELTFVVGQTTLTLGELRSLAPGFVFELPTAAGDGVTICANGKAIGKGELLEVGDRVGVRVTAFSAP